jgi:COX assembly protein 2
MIAVVKEREAYTYRVRTVLTKTCFPIQIAVPRFLEGPCVRGAAPHRARKPKTKPRTAFFLSVFLSFSIAFIHSIDYLRSTSTAATMHPPLDRPHPECQDVIVELRDCHDNNSKVKFWACNDFKSRLDQCFREEKDRMLVKMNVGFEKRRLEDDELSSIATGKNMSFQAFLESDKVYKKELETMKNKTGWFGFGF